MPRVLIADKLEASGIDLLKSRGIEVATRLGSPATTPTRTASSAR
jgi:hypothetical protein